MDWINDNLNILATLGSALAVYIFIKHAATKEATRNREESKKEFDHIKKEIANLNWEIKEIRKDIHNLDNRVARIEGHLVGMHHWEPMVVGKKEEKK